MSATTTPTRARSRRLGALELIWELAQPGSYESWDHPVDLEAYEPGYRAELEQAAGRSGADEAVITGVGVIGGHRVALIVSEFGFLAGSIGRAAAARVVQALERATAEGLPVLACPASGGTRMQEGTPAFLAMVRITAAVRAHKDAGLPYLVHLRHPTTGGVMASWGSLGHITAAEPEALLGFLGPRVYQALHGQDFPPGIQSAENLQAHGILDTIVSLQELGSFVTGVLDVVSAGRTSTGGTVTRSDRGRAQLPPPTPVWESIIRTRLPERPGIRQLLAAGAGDHVLLSGTTEGESDPHVIIGLVVIDGRGCVVVGHDRQAEHEGPGPGPAALRTARRGMRLAQDLGLPLVTVIDTAGAELSPSAEKGALAGEIARCLSDLVGLGVPIVSVLLGQGTGGAALALLPADRTVAAEHAWLAPLPPEGASAIVHRDLDHAPTMAQAQRVSTRDLLDLGAVDTVVPEGPVPMGTGPLTDRTFCQAMVRAISIELDRAADVPRPKRLEKRIARYDLHPALSEAGSSAS
ncbi:carboxyl transferase domain-containing protein [Kocuria sp. M4R2S49]|uniref:carboxyl transferase domain-containing protein n=1 Tax=Kocuria rhizosphaericola TaxID=3376284 RepID=UPI00379992CC